MVQKEVVSLSYTEHKEDVDLKIKTLEFYEFNNEYLGYQALHVHLVNKTHQAYSLDEKNISLPIVHPNEIYKKAPCIYGRYLLPSLAFFIFGCIFWWEFGFPVAGIGAFLAGQKSGIENQKNLRHLKNIALYPSRSITIEPYSTLDTIIFVRKKEYSSHFTLSLTSPNHAPLIYNVQLVARSHCVYKTT